MASRFAGLDGLEMTGVELYLQRGEYVSPQWLAKAIRRRGAKPIPPMVEACLCDVLEGKIAKPRGRHAQLTKDELLIWRLQASVAESWLYRRYLSWLHKRKQRYGHLNGWKQIRQADFWIGPPNERAARMVARSMGKGARSWRSVQNRISSRKYPANCCE